MASFKIIRPLTPELVVELAAQRVRAEERVMAQERYKREKRMEETMTQPNDPRVTQALFYWHETSYRRHREACEESLITAMSRVDFDAKLGKTASVNGNDRFMHLKSGATTVYFLDRMDGARTIYSVSGGQPLKRLGPLVSWTTSWAKGAV